MSEKKKAAVKGKAGKPTPEQSQDGCQEMTTAEKLDSIFTALSVLMEDKARRDATEKRADHRPDFKPAQKTLVSFESGHYKSFTGFWLGDSVWGHHKTTSGKVIHINKDKVEYIETEQA